MASHLSYQLILDRHPTVQDWLFILSSLGRTPATVDAYARALAHYLGYCEALQLTPENVRLEQITLYIRELLPGQPEAVANSTLHQRLTAIRLWYDHLVFLGLCEKNPLPRGQYSPQRSLTSHSGFSRGLVARLIKLPAVPNDDDWLRIVAVASRASLRDRLMLALAYYGALRRAEVVALQLEDLDLAHRLMTLRAETTKSRRSRIVCYSPAVAPMLCEHLRHLHAAGWRSGALFRSDSDRNRGQPLTRWTWSKTVAGWASAAELRDFSTHSLRHLRLTHLARAGWKLHELTTYAGHSDPKTTLVYLHLSGMDLVFRMAQSVAVQDAQLVDTLFRCSE
ncbi:site-specific integrase [Pseudomonas sp. GW531-T4]|uniref:tyrosine-type recombinase/integrase n=1 Tax=Pseudomonas sp. GW531-T4 TaxID=2075553 RepID=UPI000CD1A783|nr:site-specific integrase [Pseudomonas sp. GW531-T4]POA74905.1 integrase [Pseudomonas sp. GW531-T4]